jgi:membrane-bound ClpP family serine protease
MSILAWAILLLVAGIVILILEMFVPSSGMLGVIATMAIIGSIWLGFTHSIIAGTLLTMVAVLAVPAILLAAVHYWPKTPIGRRIIIEPPTNEEVLPESDQKDNLAALIGKRGRARTEMMPGGSVEVGGRRYDAVSDSGAIDPGTPILVIRLETRRLVVRIDDTPQPLLQPPPIDPAVATHEAPSPEPVAVPVAPTPQTAHDTKSPFDEPLI